LRILWLNWRDIKHPEAGGAEVLTHEVMQRLAKLGHEMTLFCPKVEGRANSEVIDDVKIERDGGKYTGYGKGRSYFKKHSDSYDFVIDEINPKPFLGPDVLGSKPALVLFHQLISEEWFYEMRFPLNYICNYYESKWIAPYRNTLTLTVSQSSKRDLQELGFTSVKVIPMGLSVQPLNGVVQKEQVPTILFIGRLKRHKLPDHAIKAFLLIKKKIPSAKMWIIGDGYMRLELERIKNKDITFYGHIDNKLKHELLSRAHVVLVPSVREGWGLVVPESNAMGTPVIAYDVHGLRDSVKDGENGLLVGENTPEALAHSAIEILNDGEQLLRLSNSALNFSRQFDWNNTANYFLKEIEELT